MKEISRKELENILSQNIPSESDDIWIWGGGNTAQLYQEGLSRLEKSLQNRIKGYCDSNCMKWGGICNGKPIISPDELARQENILVLVCSPTPVVIKEIKIELNLMKKKSSLIEEAILKWNKENVLQAYDAINDENSKVVYANIIYSRINGIYPPTDVYSENQYFMWNNFTSKDIGNVFIDCGAYVGDTIEKYIWNREGVFDKIIAFEPDKKNYEAMQHRIKRLHNEWNLDLSMIKTIPAGVSEKSIILKFERNEEINGLGSKFTDVCSEIAEECQVYALDEIMDSKYTFLKADIESYEYKMLLGAKSGIRRFKPMLAIAIYHNAIDFFSIILLIKQLVPEYKIAIRHHSTTLAETVLYAWVEDI